MSSQNSFEIKFLSLVSIYANETCFSQTVTAFHCQQYLLYLINIALISSAERHIFSTTLEGDFTDRHFYSIFLYVVML